MHIFQLSVKISILLKGETEFIVPHFLWEHTKSETCMIWRIHVAFHTPYMCLWNSLCFTENANSVRVINPCHIRFRAFLVDVLPAKFLNIWFKTCLIVPRFRWHLLVIFKLSSERNMLFRTRRKKCICRRYNIIESTTILNIFPIRNDYQDYNCKGFYICCLV